ncbi:hypothetical protein Syun_006763 [Stephania yunnanensis]|uniref:Uncharacterized protein n=1 Tax=Stephania yunnanensis TaxID=152371 RepID=A0AAP0KX52_9MAGN
MHVSMRRFAKRGRMPLSLNPFSPLSPSSNLFLNTPLTRLCLSLSRPSTFLHSLSTDSPSTLSFSLPEILSPKPLNRRRLLEIGASAVTASSRCVCRRWCRLPSLPMQPPAGRCYSSPLWKPRPSALALYCRGCAAPAVVRRYNGNHHRLPWPSAAAGRATSPPFAALRRYHGNHRLMPWPSTAAGRAPPAAVRCSWSLSWNALHRYLRNHHCLPSPSTAVAYAALTVIHYSSSLLGETNTSEMPPTVNELYLHVHTVNHNRVTFIDTRSERFYAKLQRRRQELIQATPDQPVDDEVVYYNMAGKCPKGRVYGLGLLLRKKRRYADLALEHSSCRR